MANTSPRPTPTANQENPMGKIIRFRLPLGPDACTWEEALESGLEICAPGELPPGVEESDFDGAYDEPAAVIPL